MTADLAGLLALTNTMLQAGFVVFFRVGGAMAALPAFGEQFLPARVRLGLAVAFTLIVAPAVHPRIIADGFALPVIVTESIVGLTIGLMLRLFVMALQVAGTIAAQATSLSQLFGGTTGEPQPAIGHLMVMGGLAVAVASGLHLQIATLLIASYDVLPPGRLPEAGAIRSWGLSGVSRSFALAFSIAAPFVLAGLIYNIALGVINRAMPQLMVAFVGAPALTAGGLALLALAVPTGLMLWHADLVDFLRNPFGAPR